MAGSQVAGSRGRSWGLRGGSLGGARPPRTPALAIGVAASLAIAPLAVPRTRLWAPGAQASLQMLLAALALAAAALLGLGRGGRRVPDLPLAWAALTLGLVTLLVWTVPAALPAPPSEAFAVAQVCGQLLAAVVLAIAAFAPRERLAMIPRGVAGAVAACWLAALGVLGALSLRLLGPAAGWSHTRGGEVDLPLLVALGALSAALMLCAAAGFARRQGEGRDLDRLLPCAMSLLLAAATADAVSPVDASPALLGPGQALRAMAFVALLALALRRRRDAGLRDEAAAVRTQRRWLAADLHDGLAQDLATIAAHGASLSRQLGAEHPVVLAASRALDACRGTIGELAAPPDAPLEEALELIADEVGARHGIDVSLDVRLDAEPGAQLRAQVLRIAREALVNAARHGGARTAVVSVCAQRGSLTLRVLDDGRGVTQEAIEGRSSGFGLRFLHARAAAIGGQLTIGQRRLGGTELKLEVR